MGLLSAYDNEQSIVEQIGAASRKLADPLHMGISAGNPLSWLGSLTSTYAASVVSQSNAPLSA